jgi:hypothetical protein
MDPNAASPTIAAAPALRLGDRLRPRGFLDGIHAAPGAAVAPPAQPRAGEAAAQHPAQILVGRDVPRADVPHRRGGSVDDVAGAGRVHGRGSTGCSSARDLGFSLWQFVDVVLFHWILGIHRILGSTWTTRSFWDVGWLLVFGCRALILGLGIRRAGPGRRGRGREGAREEACAGARAASVALLAALAGPVAPPCRSRVPPRCWCCSAPTSPRAQAFAAVGAADGRVVWAHESGPAPRRGPRPRGPGTAVSTGGALMRAPPPAGGMPRLGASVRAIILNSGQGTRGP